MNLYTKCSKCEKELSVLIPSNTVDDGITVNDNVFCKECWEEEVKSVLESKQKVLNKIGLGGKHQQTEVKDNVLYIVTDIGNINKDYYGTDDYTFITNTLTGQMAICKNGENYIYLDTATPIGAISNIIIVVKFMCD